MGWGAPAPQFPRVGGMPPPKPPAQWVWGAAAPQPGGSGGREPPSPGKNKNQHPLPTKGQLRLSASSITSENPRFGLDKVLGSTPCRHMTSAHNVSSKLNYQRGWGGMPGDSKVKACRGPTPQMSKPVTSGCLYWEAVDPDVLCIVGLRGGPESPGEPRRSLTLLPRKGLGRHKGW